MDASIEPTTTPRRAWAAALLGVAKLPLFVFAILALSSGRAGWPRMWLLLALLGALVAVNLPLLAWRNPALLRERFKRRADTKPFDRLFAALSLPILAAFLGVAGLEGGRWGPALPDWTVWLGVGLHALGDVPVLAAMLANPHLETTVRIQKERAHAVVRSGPYRLVRHPMYVGMLVMFAGWPLVLGSRWAYLPYALYLALLVWRTSREDRALQAELAGYADYARRTRYRLLPGVW